MPEKQEKPRVDLRQVITSPQFLSGMNTLIRYGQDNEARMRCYLETKSGVKLYDPAIKIGTQEEVSENSTNIVPYPSNIPGTEFLPRKPNWSNYQGLVIAHTHPPRGPDPSTKDLVRLNDWKQFNAGNSTNPINPVIAAVGIPSGKDSGLYEVLFIQESEREPLTEEQIKRIPVGPNWQRARHSNPHYNQVQAMFNKNNGRMEILSEPFTLFV